MQLFNICSIEFGMGYVLLIHKHHCNQNMKYLFSFFSITQLTIVRRIRIVNEGVRKTN